MSELTSPSAETAVLDLVSDRATSLLRCWCEWAETYWYQPADQPDAGCFGTGYGHWGVQTNQKYCAAAATLSGLGDDHDGEAQRWADRAVASLRYSLATHVTGDRRCADNRQWGLNWISVLGLERMAFALPFVEDRLTAADHAAVRRVFVAEADYIAEDYVRGSHRGAQAQRWASSGKNNSESNLWSGAFAWRVAATYPNHPNAGRWREEACRFLINSVSIDADADDLTVVDGKPVRDRHVGAGFFDHFSFDHHGYTNVGYMVICLSQQAFLHFDAKASGWSPPESLYWHAQDLWRVTRRLIFGDGRLARIGGDSRIRYAYCQEYLLPTLLFAADHFRDPHAIGLLQQQLDWIVTEARHNETGSFFGERLAWLARQSPYYTTRLESDRAVALAMTAAYVSGGLIESPTVPTEPFEASVAGSWAELEHGDVVHRCATRFASFAWRAHGVGQGLCLRPNDGHAAEWQNNLTGSVRFLGDAADARVVHHPQRRLIDHHIEVFDGGFVTAGSFIEGVSPQLDEGWVGQDMAMHHFVFAALPDEHTVVGMQLCHLRDMRGYLAEVKGLHLNIPNDLFNRMRRSYRGDTGVWRFQSPAQREEVLPLDTPWVSVDGRFGVVGLYGAETLTVHRTPQRRGGPYRSLYVDQLCFGCRLGPLSAEPGEVVLDVGWAVTTVGQTDQVRRFSSLNQAAKIDTGDRMVRMLEIVGMDDRNYIVLSNFAAETKKLDLAAGPLEIGAGRPIVLRDPNPRGSRPI